MQKYSAPKTYKSFCTHTVYTSMYLLGAPLSLKNRAAAAAFFMAISAAEEVVVHGESAASSSASANCPCGEHMASVRQNQQPGGTLGWWDRHET